MTPPTDVRTFVEREADKHYNGVFGQCFCGRFLYGTHWPAGQCGRCWYSLRASVQRAKGSQTSVQPATVPDMAEKVHGEG